MKVKTELWSHQNKMLEFALNRINADGVQIGDGWDAVEIGKGFTWWLAGCSTGKTLAAYSFIEKMAYKRVLVITTKAGAISAWQKDAEKHLEDVNIVIPVGLHKNDKRTALEHNGEKTLIYVINYESVWRILPEIINANFELIITDESHKIKAHNSKQSIGIAEIATHIPHRLAMTGTGFEEKPTDIYGQVRFLDPIRVSPKRYKSNILGTWTTFFDKYVNYIRYNNIPIIKGYKNQNELLEIIHPFTLYVDSEEVLDLPSVLHIERKIEMPEKIRKVYLDVKRNFLANIDGQILTSDSVLEQSIRLHQITSGYHPDKDGISLPIVPDNDNPKLQEVIAILDEIGGKPTVIFTRFKEDVNMLKRNLEKIDYEVKLLTGQTNEQMDWQHNKKGQILIANIQAGGEAVDLTRARYCIYYSLGHSRASYVQSLARTRRVGADLNFPITYYHIIMENTIDVNIRTAMEGKGELVEYLIGGLQK